MTTEQISNINQIIAKGILKGKICFHENKSKNITAIIPGSLDYPFPIDYNPFDDLDQAFEAAKNYGFERLSYSNDTYFASLAYGKNNESHIGGSGDTPSGALCMAMIQRYFLESKRYEFKGELGKYWKRGE